MFDVGFAEIFLLALVGLIVLGPDKLPRVARTLGGLVRRARTSWYSLRRSIEAELAATDVSETLKETKRGLGETRKELDAVISDGSDSPTPETPRPDPKDD
ncbi:MAG: twin-arginine translocase subunit TatB [Xanthomonadales bacterium]|nr:twin-arginine translocase subunit TatB [Xanthomonadales bacterium]